jgi:hypothetical protein
MTLDRTFIVVEMPADPDPLRLAFRGRVAWTLGALIDAGPRGVTPLERPAPRWSAYVHTLRKAGVIVDTIEEPHAGAYRGWHGRYILRSDVRTVAEDFAA